MWLQYFWYFLEAISQERASRPIRHNVEAEAAKYFSLEQSLNLQDWNKHCQDILYLDLDLDCAWTNLTIYKIAKENCLSPAYNQNIGC